MVWGEHCCSRNSSVVFRSRALFKGHVFSENWTMDEGLGNNLPIPLSLK